MITNIGIGLFILIFSVSLNAEPPGRQLPPEVLFLAKRHYPDFEIIRPDDLNDGLKKWFKESYPDKYPGYVKADFNGDTEDDYAVFLTKKLRDIYKYKVKLVVFLSSAKKGFKPIVISEDDYDVPCYMYLEYISSGAFVRETRSGKNTNKKKYKLLNIRLPF